MTSFTVRPAEEIRGTAKVPSDKSISHRAFLLAALAEGTSVVHGPLDALDVRATMAAVRKLGAVIREKDGCCEVDGPGIGGLNRNAGAIDCGNSGTLMRLLCGICVAGRVACTLVGDESLSARPMQRVVEPLRRMGADIRSNDGKPPLEIRPVSKLVGIDYESPVASAQVKSAVLLAGLGAEGRTSVTEPAQSRNHTEDMLEMFGRAVFRDDLAVAVDSPGGRSLKPAEVHVPADISSAAFFLVAGAAATKGQVHVDGVSFNPTRAGVISILELMGADLMREDPDSGLAARASRPSLKGIRIPERLVPSAIDEFPAIFVAAAVARGDTVLRGASELRVKESDRIASMAAGLRTLGVQVEEYEDGIRITGNPDGFSGGSVDSFGDHRVAMALAIAGALGNGEVTVRNCDNVATSFPGFRMQCGNVGIDMTEQQETNGD